MEVLYTHCAGLDIHKEVVLACRITPDAQGQPRKEVQRFKTLTQDLLRLGDWLAEAEVTHVAMEGTGVYWKPLYNLLEDRFALLLANARHIKQVPGRKTDVRDCEWIADLLRHGLLRPSFVPPRPQRELRELTRYRTSLTEEKAAETNRLQKTLEGGNVKLTSVASKVLGVSGRRMVQALAAGEADVAVVADLAVGSLRQKVAQLAAALEGRLERHQRFLLTLQLARIERLEADIAQVSAEIAARLAAEAAVLERLDAIPGVGRRLAEIIVAEIGTDMTAFPTAGQLASWAGLCPGNHESAGKRLSGRTRKGNKALRAALVEAAQAAAHTKDTYLRSLYDRLAARRGRKRAVIAVAHRQIRVVHHLLRTGESYSEAGYQELDGPDRERQAARLRRRLEQLGYRVALEPVA